MRRPRPTSLAVRLACGAVLVSVSALAQGSALPKARAVSVRAAIEARRDDAKLRVSKGRSALEQVASQPELRSLKEAEAEAAKPVASSERYLRESRAARDGKAAELKEKEAGLETMKSSLEGKRTELAELREAEATAARDQDAEPLETKPVSPEGEAESATPSRWGSLLSFLDGVNASKASATSGDGVKPRVRVKAGGKTSAKARDLERDISDLVDRIRWRSETVSDLKRSLGKKQEEVESDERRLSRVLGPLEEVKAKLQPFEEILAHSHATIAMDEARVVTLDGRLASADQHWLTLESREARDAHAEAVHEAKGFAAVVAKPDQVSQDAVAMNPAAGRYAVADGVSNSWGQHLFAQMLVRRFAAAPPKNAEEFPQWLTEAQSEWHAEVDKLSPAPAGASRYSGKTQPRVGKSTLLGVQVVDEPGTGKQAVHILGRGDTNFFLVRGDKLIHAFPYTDHVQFSDKVAGFSTTDGRQPRILEETYPIEPDDEGYIFSDAVAAWVLEDIDRGRNPFRILRMINSREKLARFVELARDGALKGREEMELNIDDSSVVRFKIAKPSPLN